MESYWQWQDLKDWNFLMNRIMIFGYFLVKKWFPPADMEGRRGDEISDMVRQISDEAAFMELEAERKALEVLEAGCHAAIGIIAQVKEQEITLRIRTEWKGQTLEREETAECSDRILLAERLALDIKAMVAASD